MKTKYLYYSCIVLLSLIIVFLITNIAKFNNKTEIHTNEIILQQTIQNIPNIESFQITDSTLIKKINNKIIILFPYNICDLCFQKTFEQISNLDSEVKINFTGVIPTKFARNYQIYNKKYNLKLDSIIYTNSLQELSVQIDDNILVFFFNQERGILSPLLLNKAISFFPEYTKKLYDSFVEKQ